jgi:signal transduction histidine kinase
MMNLVRNAVQSISGGGRITVSTDAPIWQGHRQWVELSIEDSGEGLPESVRNSLFKPVRSTKGPGHSGLGLSIVKQLIDDMEGIISCRTGQDGTCFRILLPAATDTQKEGQDDKDASVV